MKKLIFIFAIILVAICLYSYKKNKGIDTSTATQPKEESTVTDEASKKDINKDDTSPDTPKDGESEEDAEDSEEEIDVRPAVDVYKTSDEALKAVRKAALNYDDVVLEQFYMLSNCSWCNKFYGELQKLMVDKSLSSEERTYYAEILSTTGKKENIEALVNATINAGDATEKDIFSEALELSNLSNESLRYLKDEYAGTTDEALREATIGAISGQGTKESIEILYDITKENGDPDGFYKDGIGLGEVVPEDSAYPLLDELTSKRDQYSHLAAKAMLNGGIEGTKRMINILGNTKNPEADIKLFDLEKAADHVLYDDETKAFLSSIENPNDAQKYFIDNVIKSSKNDDNADDE